MVELTREEQRVLGSLIEKEALTPDQYPLTLNSLLLACNQTTSREPVVLYDRETLTGALSSLREKQLTRVVYPAHARVTKYRHVIGEVWALTEQEQAVLAVLLLRGPQTVAEQRPAQGFDRLRVGVARARSHQDPVGDRHAARG